MFKPLKTTNVQAEINEVKGKITKYMRQILDFMDISELQKHYLDKCLGRIVLLSGERNVTLRNF